MPGRKGGKVFTAKGDRMANDVAASYGGGRAGLSIGYAVATIRGERLDGHGTRKSGKGKGKKGGKRK